MKRSCVLAVAALTVCAATTNTAVADQPPRSAPSSVQAQAKPPAVEVMTRNIYLGVDVTRPLVAAAGLEGLDALLAVAHEAHAMEDTLAATDFRTRARLLAREISRAKPDLVGLQEVAKWRSGPVQFLPPEVGVPNATDVDADYLRILLRALRKAGEPYQAVAIQEESDVEVPSFLGNPFDPEDPMTDAEDVRVTISDVVLKRKDSRVRVLKSGGDQYDARLSLGLAGVNVDFVRGFAWVTAKQGSQRFRFVTTHLEAFSSGLALQQVQELLAGPAAYPGNTIVVGDFNSDPLDDSVDGSGVQHKAAYDATVASGFFDQWLRWAPAEQGWTSGLSETVDDETAAGFDHRIDFVFGRTGSDKAFRVRSGDVTGDRLRDRDPATGLWPSDHAGVVLDLLFRRAG